MMDGWKRVLVIGKDAAMGERIRTALRGRGIEARTATVAEAAEGNLEVTGLDLIAFGGGVEPPLRRTLKERFSARNREAILLNVFAPVAVEQIEQALRGEDGRHEFASCFTICDYPNEIAVRLELVRSCRVRVKIYHLGEKLRGRVVADRECLPGPFEVRVGRSRLGRGPNMILAIAGEREFYFERIEPGTHLAGGSAG